MTSVFIGRLFQRGRYGLNQGKEEGRLRLALFFHVEITMPKGPFLPSDFTATKFSTAADKAEFGNTLLHFIESEWAPALFTKSFYNRLSMCFSHIAHYNRTQFYEEWFSSLAVQVRFLKLTLRFPCYGDGPKSPTSVSADDRTKSADGASESESDLLGPPAASRHRLQNERSSITHHFAFGGGMKVI